MAITLKPIAPKNLSFWIKSISIMVQHQWSEKGLGQLAMTAQERKKQPKTARDPEGDAAAACYRTDKGEYGIPLVAFKAALIGAAHKDFGLEKTLLRKALFVPTSDSGGIIPIETEDYILREDIVRVGIGQTDIRYRPQFTTWRANIVIQIDTELLKPEDIVNLVNRAGFSVGIGEWRPEKGGEWGRFELDTSEPMEVIG